MMMVGALIAIAAGAVVLFGLLFFFKKKASGGGGAERQAKIDAVQTVIDETKQMALFADAYASHAQLGTVSKQLDDARVAVEAQKNQLKEIEAKLDSAQKQVEEKEAAQQAIKSVKEEDEQKLAEVLAKYEETSTESIQLEQQIALSMKNLDQIMSEVTMTADQKSAFEELSNSLTAAGSRLRDLITEYETMKERLEMLKQQHTDLEEEYTRLVEQQLGE